eukprot:3065579-Pyramimonas_sp.AAC.1
MEEQQTGTTSDGFKAWFRSRRGDEQASEHLKALFSTLEAQAAAARNSVSFPPAVPSDDVEMEFGESDEQLVECAAEQ